MDSQGKDGPKIRRSDETLARRVAEALDQLKSRGAEACPDAEVVAAYAEQSLDPAGSTRWEGHFAACPRCRNVLRVLAASADTPLAEKEVARLGELVAAAQAPAGPATSSAERPRSWLADWRMRWLAPALGVATVLAVWFAMRPPWRAKEGGPSPTLVAQAPANQMPLTPAPEEQRGRARVAPAQDQRTKADTSGALDESRSAPLPAPAKEPAKKGSEARDRLSASANEVASALEEKDKLNRAPEARELQPRAAPMPPPPAEALAATGTPAAPVPQAKAGLRADASGAAQVESPPNAAANATSQTGQTVIVQENVPVSGAATNETVPQTARAGAARKQAFTITMRPVQKYASLLKAPASSILWRAGAGGMIERSDDAGKTWVSQASPSREDWLAGWAASDMVCWVAGRHGAMARTVDGQRWDPVPPPAQAAGKDGSQPDWTAITARDAQSATVSASDGRKFATADAGKTWQPL
jgi:hypothetical protein